MGFRFRKSVRVAPGLRLNLSKGGVSTSVGRPGAMVNLGKNGPRATVGIPGSGLSYTTKLKRGRSGQRSSESLAASSDQPVPDKQPHAASSTLIMVVCLCFSIIAASVAAGSVVGWIGWFVALTLFGIFMSALGQHSAQTAKPDVTAPMSSDPDQRERLGVIASL